MKLLLSMFAYPFIVRAFVVGILVSLCASLLGVPLVLKRYSMIGDGLSHVSFGALSVAVACGFAPLWFSIPVVVIAAFILMHVAEKSRVSADAMIGGPSARTRRNASWGAASATNPIGPAAAVALPVEVPRLW